MLISIQALQIMRPDSGCQTHAIHVTLDPHDIAPDNKDTSYVFTLKSVIITPIETVHTMLWQKGWGEPFTHALADQVALLRTGVRGKKVSAFMMLIVEASNQLIISPEVILEEELSTLPSESPG